MNPLFAGPRNRTTCIAVPVAVRLIPQLATPTEQAWTPPALGEFALPNAAEAGN